MPSIGPLEIMVVAVVALIVFGPQRLPEMARSIGRALADFRRAASDMKRDFDLALDEEDDDEDDTAVPTSAKKQPEDEAGRFPATTSDPETTSADAVPDRAAASPARKTSTRKQPARKASQSSATSAGRPKVSAARKTTHKKATSRAKKTATSTKAAKKTVQTSQKTTRSASGKRSRKT